MCLIQCGQCSQYYNLWYVLAVLGTTNAAHCYWFIM